MKDIKEIKCSFCQGKMELDPSDCEPEKAIVYSGAVNWFSIGYGSKFDLEKWLLAICDECLEKVEPLKTEDILIG